MIKHNEFIRNMLATRRYHRMMYRKFGGKKNTKLSSKGWKTLNYESDFFN